MHRLFLTVVLALCVLAVQASATWLPDGVPVCSYPPCVPANPRIVADGAGGVFVAWQDARSRLSQDFYAHHLTANGDRAPGWPADGLPVCVSPASKGNPRLVADGQGGFFACWTDGRNPSTAFDIYVQHVRGDGTLAPGWPVNGLPASLEPGSDQAGKLMLDGSGGIYVTWDGPFDTVWIQHLTSTGAPAPGWPSDGLEACTLPSLFGISVADGIGGAVMVWTDFRRGGSPDGYDVYGSHYTAGGALAPGWVPNGNLLAPGEWRALALADSAGKFYLVSSTPSPYGFLDVSYSVRRLSVDGTPVPGWTARGVVVGAAPGDRTGILAIPDGAGGVLLEWNDFRGGGDDVYGARLLPSGTPAPGWPAEGLIVSDPSLGYDSFFGLAADGSGGGYFSFQYDYPSYVQHITAAGTVAPGWLPYGFRLATTSSQFNPQLVPAGAGGAIAVWEELGGIGSRNGLFAQRFEPNGPVPVAVKLSLASTEATLDRVVLVWDGPGAGNLTATVERRTEESAWQPLGPASTAGTDRLRYEDRGVLPGSRYAYRLALGGGGAPAYTAESWVDVPRGYRLALAGFRPNPATGAPTVAFALADASPATLELLDVSGRRLLAREVGGLGAGAHTLRLEDAAVPPGVYWIRLAQSGAVRCGARGLVVR